MIPAKFVRPAALGDMKPGSFLKVVARDGADILIGTLHTGEKVACFMSGPNKGRGFSFTTNTAWHGLGVSEIEFELDLESAYDHSDKHLPGALVRAGDRLEMLVSLKAEGFAEARRVLLASGLPSTDAKDEIGFARWTVVARDDADRYEVFNYDAEGT